MRSLVSKICNQTSYDDGNIHKSLLLSLDRRGVKLDQSRGRNFMKLMNLREKS